MDFVDRSPVEVSIAGSTGSVGTQALDVISKSSGQFLVAGLSANSNVRLLASQANFFRPGVVGIGDPSRAKELESLLEYSPSIAVEGEVASAICTGSAVVLNSVVGFAGLAVTLAALKCGKRLALANKESMVAAGELVAKVRRANGGEIIPVDSEHSAIHQAMRSSFYGHAEVAKLVLTASGGPFRGQSASYLSNVTLDDALAHPTWSMGPKISVDSSTLMNKGLEVIEAHELFEVEYDHIEVVIHPQSIIHSIVEFTDGSAVAQMAGPDMRVPIGYALAYPERLKHSFGALDWKESRSLEFETPDLENFPSLVLAYEAGRRGGGAPAWLNAANEVAVAAFIAGKIGWMDIYRVVEKSFDRYVGVSLNELSDVLDTDSDSREYTRGLLN